MAVGSSSQHFSAEEWEVLGERVADEGFAPLEVQVVTPGGYAKAALFEDFSTRQPPTGASRRHISEGDTEALEAAEAAQAEDEAHYIRIHQSEMEARLEKAREEGRQVAFEEAVEVQNARMVEEQKKVFQTIKDLIDQEREFVGGLEKQAVNLALEISRKIIEQAVEINPEYIVEVVRSALGLTGGSPVKKVRVSKQDFEFIEVLGVTRDLREYDGSWQFEADETIKAGCIVETAGSLVDFQLDKAWDRIKDEIVKIAK